MSEHVTDADRETARAFVVDIIDSPTPEYRDEVERDLAAALAAEREKARAPFLALADMVERDALESAEPDDPDGAEHIRACALLLVAHSIRRAAKEAQQ